MHWKSTKKTVKAINELYLASFRNDIVFVIRSSHKRIHGMVTAKKKTNQFSARQSAKESIVLFAQY